MSTVLYITVKRLIEFKTYTIQDGYNEATEQSNFPYMYLFIYFLLFSFGFFLPYPTTGMPSAPIETLESGARLPFPPVPTLNISGTQSGSIQLPIFTPVDPPDLAASSTLCKSFRSSRSFLPSTRFFARMYSAWSSRRISPSPFPALDDPGLGAGIE